MLKLNSVILQIISFLSIIATIGNVTAQTYVPGNTYTDATGYVEYRAGNLPIVLSVPHGGYLEPTAILDRSCAGCITTADSFTQEITDGIYQSIVNETGCYPHVIINLLHRKKFDANRDVQDAANGDPTVILSWNNYHNYIDIAKAHVVQNYGSGTFYDMHGHAHAIQRIELGYLLTTTELQQTDHYLNTNSGSQDSSIRTLVSSNLQNLTQAQLIRGTNSLGDILENRGLSSIPSSVNPAPLNSEPYFSGGYNTRRHGSSDNISTINAIQIELNSDLRFNSAIRPALVDSLARTIIDFHTTHYNNQPSSSSCTTLNINELNSQKKTFLYPNPSSEVIHIQSDSSIKSYMIYDKSGKKVWNHSYDRQRLDISKLESGLYFLILQYYNGRNGTFKIVKTD
ncbi:T9SS type A sorting domain-containing protein [Nonlabens mediterrranea]|uniref:T9SS type A sorting domain-containing protein n=1 Tax=Nonlabens mediterrranea TaxID=1419947 RepID=A0ABS0A7S7_9FLAO|nr:T9SS type A sorting domain-containing protein [Nonlabens mediterrranea]